MVYLYYYGGATTGIVQVLTGTSYYKVTLYANSVREYSNGNDYLLSAKTELFASSVISALIFDKQGIPFVQYGDFHEFFELFKSPHVLQDLRDGQDEVYAIIGEHKVALNLWQKRDYKLTRKNLYTDGLIYSDVSNEHLADITQASQQGQIKNFAQLERTAPCDWIFNYEEVEPNVSTEENDLQKKLAEDAFLASLGLDAELESAFHQIQQETPLDYYTSNQVEMKKVRTGIKKHYEMANTLDKVQGVVSQLKELPDKTHIGFGVLTDGNNFYYDPEDNTKSHLIGISIAFSATNAVYIPFISSLFPVVDKDTAMRLLYPELTRLGLIMYDSKFIWRVMYDNGYTLEPTDDIQLLDFNIYAEGAKKGQHSFLFLTDFFFSEKPWVLKDLCVHKADPKLVVFIPEDIMTIYGNILSSYTLALYDALIPYLNQSQVYPYKLDCNIVELVAKAEYYGVRVDRKLLRENRLKLMADVAVLEKFMREYIRTEGWNLYKDSIITQRYENIQAQHPEMDTEQLLECFNLGFDEFITDSESRYKEKLDKLLKSSTAFTGTKQLSTILYEILQYPVVLWNKPSQTQLRKDEERKMMCKITGQKFTPTPSVPSTNTKAMTILKSYILAEPNEILKQDLMSAMGGVLIQANYAKNKPGVNNMRYPFAYMLEKHRKITKLLTTFYNKNADKSSDYLHEDYSMTDAETFRITGPMQTIAGTNKQMILPLKGWNMCIADKSQMEFRNMFGEANRMWEGLKSTGLLKDLSIWHQNGLSDIINALNSPESDIHRENGAPILGIKAYEMTNEQRHDVKRDNFSMPYGAEVWSLSADDLIKYVDSLSGEGSTDGIIADHGISMNKWNFVNYPLYKYLQYKRQEPFKPLEEGDKKPPYLETYEVGYVTNALGRRRWFFIDSLTDYKKAEIARASGNFPIQSLSRDYFFIDNLNLYRDAKACGYVKNPTNGEKPTPDKFLMTAYVHDEFLNMYKGIHPYKLVKMIYKNCFVRYTYHPVYYMGINFVNNWYEGKTGENELPVLLVKQLVDTPEDKYPEFRDNMLIYKGNPIDITSWFACLVEDYRYERVCKEFHTLHEVIEKTFPESLGTEQYWSRMEELLVSYHVRPIISQIYQEFSDNTLTKFADILKWVSEFNYVSAFDRFIERQNKTEQQDAITKDEQAEVIDDLFTDLFGTVDSSETDQIHIDLDKIESAPSSLTNYLLDSLRVINGEVVDDSLALGRVSYKDIRELIQENRDDELTNEYFNLEEHVSEYVLQERGVYTARNNYVQGEVDTRVIIDISGMVVLNLTQYPPALYSKILSRIQSTFADPNGSIIRIHTNLKLQRLNFRVRPATQQEYINVLNEFV